MEFTRITCRPDQLGGTPCIRELRIPVVRIVYMLAAGASEDEILDNYPDLEREDIREALRFAGETMEQQALPLAR